MNQSPMAIEAIGLRKSFGALAVTRDVSFPLPDGVAPGVIGPDGAGKTTLFKLLTGGLTDAECSERIEFILSINSAGVTIIRIEHVLHALQRVVDRVIVLDFGQRIAEGEPRTIMQSREVSAICLGLEDEEVADG